MHVVESNAGFLTLVYTHPKACPIFDPFAFRERSESNPFSPILVCTEGLHQGSESCDVTFLGSETSAGMTVEDFLRIRADLI